jgi:hypothetical protein
MQCLKSSYCGVNENLKEKVIITNVNISFDSFQKLQKGIENKNMSNFSPTTVTEIISGHRLDIELWLMGHLFFRTSWNQFWRDKSGPKEWRPFFSMINIIISYGYFPKKTKHRYVWTCYLLVSLPLFAEYRFFSDR